MTDEKLLAATTAAREILARYSAMPRRHEEYRRHLDPRQTHDHSLAADHAFWMCEMIPQFVEVGAREKAMRWLGFVQGVLWTLGLVSIDDLKDANRSDPK